MDELAQAFSDYLNGDEYDLSEAAITAAMKALFHLAVLNLNGSLTQLLEGDENDQTHASIYAAIHLSFRAGWKAAREAAAAGEPI